MSLRFHAGYTPNGRGRLRGPSRESRSRPQWRTSHLTEAIALLEWNNGSGSCIKRQPGGEKMDTTRGDEMTAMLARLGSAWGWIVAYGAATVLAGAVAILWPSSTLVVIAIIFAVQLLLGAVYQFVFAFAVPNESGWLRALFALLSIFSFVVAIYLFAHV